MLPRVSVVPFPGPGIGVKDLDSECEQRVACRAHRGLRPSTTGVCEKDSDRQVVNYAIGQLQKRHDNPFFLGVGRHKPHLPGPERLAGNGSTDAPRRRGGSGERAAIPRCARMFEARKRKGWRPLRGPHPFFGAIQVDWITAIPPPGIRSCVRHAQSQR